MVPLSFDIGITDLEIEELRAFRISRNAPVVIVEKTPQETELALAVQHLDRNKIIEPANKRLDMLFEKCPVAFDLRPQHRPHSIAGELRLQFLEATKRILGQPG